MTNNLPAYRDPNKIFESAIASGVLSRKENASNFVGNYMYMGDNKEGKALFKHSITRAYLPPAAVVI